MAHVPLLRCALAVLVSMTAAACDSGNGGDPEPDATATATATASAAVPGSPEEDGVAVTMTDFAFEPATLTVPATGFALTLTNSGSVQHSFTVDQPKIDTVVEPGGTAQVLVALGDLSQADFYCKFHQAQGMTGTVTVSEP